MHVDSIGGWRIEHYQIIADVYVSKMFPKRKYPVKTMCLVATQLAFITIALILVKENHGFWVKVLMSNKTEKRLA